MRIQIQMNQINFLDFLNFLNFLNFLDFLNRYRFLFLDFFEPPSALETFVECAKAGVSTSYCEWREPTLKLIRVLPLCK